VIARIQEASKDKDEELASLDAFLELGKERPLGPIAKIPGKGAMESMTDSSSELDVDGKNVRSNVARLSETGSIGAMDKKYEVLSIDQLNESLTVSGISSSEKEFIRNKIDSIGENRDPGGDDENQFGVANAAIETAENLQEDEEVGYEEKTMFAGSKNNRTKNIRVRSSPKAVDNEGNLITKIRPGTEVNVIGEDGKWRKVRFIENNEEVIGWIASSALRGSK